MGLLFTFPPAQVSRSALGPERSRLLEAALKVFAAHDYSGASLKRIAAEAEVTAAMVNYYFGSKEQLYATVVEAAFKHLQELVASRCGSAHAFEVRVTGFVEAHDRFATSLPDASELMVRAAFRPENSRRSEPERYRPLRLLAREILEAGVAQGEVRLAGHLDAHRAAEHLLGQVEMLLIQRVQQRRFPAAGSPRFTAEEVVLLFLHGVCDPARLRASPASAGS
jgi:AcrR family transcriptional regulator